MDKRRPVWPLIAAALIGVPVLYVTSFGPAYWLASHDRLPCKRQFAWIYRPLISLARSSRGPTRSWAQLFAAQPKSPFWAESDNIWFDFGLDVPFRSGQFEDDGSPPVVVDESGREMQPWER